MTFFRQWYALHTGRDNEHKVSASLSKKGFEYYHPMYKVLIKTGDKKKNINYPLFPSCIFVRAAVSDFESLKRIPGVLSLLYWLKEPFVIRDTEMEIIRQFLHEHKNVQLQKTGVNMNETVRVLSEVVPEKEDKTPPVNNGQIQLLLPSFGCILSAEVETEKAKIFTEKFTSQTVTFGNLEIVR